MWLNNNLFNNLTFYITFYIQLIINLFQMPIIKVIIYLLGRLRN